MILTHQFDIVGNEDDVNATEAELRDAQECVDQHLHEGRERAQAGGSAGKHQLHGFCEPWRLVPFALQVHLF